MLYGSRDHSPRSHIIVTRYLSQKKTTICEYRSLDQSLSTLNHAENEKEHTSCDLHLD